MINIVSIGPGNSIDYLTVKAHRTLQQCDIGIYPGDFIGQDICSIFTKKILHKGRELKTETIKSLIIDYLNNNKTIAIMVSGDMSLYSGQQYKQPSITEYVTWLNEQSIAYHIEPGLGSLALLCAQNSLDLTNFSATQNVFITSIERLIATQQFDIMQFEHEIKSLPVLVLYQSINAFETIQPVIQRHYSSSTKITIAQSLSWKNEYSITCQLGDIDKALNNYPFNDQTLIVITPT